jgi:hypothetical protein
MKDAGPAVSAELGSDVGSSLPVSGSGSGEDETETALPRVAANLNAAVRDACVRIRVLAVYILKMRDADGASLLLRRHPDLAKALVHICCISEAVVTK